MRILHVTKKYPNALGGDAIVVSNIEKQQKKQGHEVFILTSNCDDIHNNKNVIKFGKKIKAEELDRINLKRIFSLRTLKKKAYQILKDINPDIIHSHSSDLGYAISFAARKYNIPIINTCHGVTFNDNQYPLPKRRLELFLLKNAKYDKIITVDPTSVKDFEKNGFSNVIYLPNGVDLDEFKFAKRKTNKIKRIIFVGRLEKQKGIDYLIDAVNIIKKSEFELSLVGDGNDKEKLIKQVKFLNLDKKISFLGKKNKKDLVELYSKSDIFVLPSIWEGFSLTILEAWAFKLPIIVTNVGAVSKVCRNNYDSLVVQSKDSKALADAILKIIGNIKLAKRLGENGRKLVESKYSWKKVTKEIENVYLESM